MASYESIFPGSAYTSLTPAYYSEPINYQTKASNLGMSLDPRTANQLGMVNTNLNSGNQTVEVQGTIPESFESMPEQHLDEIRRQLKLAGARASFHGPVIETSGVGERGFQEENRVKAEKQVESAVLRAQKLDPDGNISVTVHSTANLPDLRPMVKTKDGEKQEGLWVVNEETGQFNQIKPETRYFEEGEEFKGEKIEFDADKELARTNREFWTENLSQINRLADFGEQTLEGLKREYPEEIYSQIGKIDLDKIKDENDKRMFESAQRAVTHSQIYLRDSYRSMKMLFDRAWANVKNEEDKKRLKGFAEWAAPQIKEGIETDPEKINKLRDIVTRGLKDLSQIKSENAPKMWKPMDEFVTKKSAETFANVAESAYSKYGNKAPILNIENAPAGGGLSTGEDLKKLVVTSREQLAKNLVDNKGLSKSQAKEVAAKMIGATWDVGHINMLRKKGYTEKDIIKETKTIAPFVKHVHLSDNFGIEHTELPMGMGNVPLKPMMDELKKQGFKGKQIIEAANWWQYFAEHGGGSPFKPSLEAFDSPIYAMKEGPGWAYTGRFGSYYSGMGPINPAVHHNTYGAGFQTLPMELGGEIPGGQSRFAGTPNQ